jgi:septal ring factor EnvC (AmiA/AmiB activator)
VSFPPAHWRRLRPLLLTALLAGTLSPAGLPSAAAQSSGSLGNPANDPNFKAKLPTTSERLQQLQQQLSAQKQLSAQQKADLESLRARVAQLGSQQQAALNRIDALDANIARLETARRALDVQIQSVQQVIRDLNVQIAGTQARVDRLQQDVRELLVSLYRERSGRYLQLLSQASSLSDLLIRAKYANISGQNNVQVVQALKTETARLQTDKATQAAQQKQLETLQARQVAQLQQLQTQRQEQATLVAQLKQNQAGQQALAVQTQAQQALTASSIQNVIGGILQERNNIEAERQRLIAAEQQRRAAELARIRAEQEAARQEQLRLARLKAEQERQIRVARAARDRQALLAQQQARQARQDQVAREQQALQNQQQTVENQQQQSQVQATPLPANVGEIGFPLPGGQITAAFNSPNPWTVMSGQAGGQAVAVAPGNVLGVLYYANLGWVVVINHGSVSSTSFGLLQPLVSVGQSVNRGQALGVVGGSPQFGPTSMAFSLSQNDNQRPIRPPF